MDLAKHLDSAYRAFGVTREEAGGLRSTRPEVVALELGQLGFRVFPAAGETKTPIIGRWQFRASTDPRKIEAWYQRYKQPDCELNWLALFGRDGGAWLIDIDGPQGREDLARLEEELGPLPRTWTTESGRVGGGEHRWFRVTPGDIELMNQQHMFGYSIDVRAWHGYAVIPGSIHAASRLRYRWREGCAPGECELAELPPAWIEYLPKKNLSEAADAPKPRGPRAKRGPVARREHNATSRLIGDGNGFGGFQNPIYKISIDYFFRAGADAPAEIIISALREMIVDAPKDKGRDVSRYMDGPDLARVVERARDFVNQVKEQEIDEYEYELSRFG